MVCCIVTISFAGLCLLLVFSFRPRFVVCSASRVIRGYSLFFFMIVVLVLVEAHAVPRRRAGGAISVSRGFPSRGRMREWGWGQGRGRIYDLDGMDEARLLSPVDSLFSSPVVRGIQHRSLAECVCVFFIYF